MVEKSVFWQKMCIEGKFDLFFFREKTKYIEDPFFGKMSTKQCILCERKQLLHSKTLIPIFMLKLSSHLPSFFIFFIKLSRKCRLIRF